MSWIQVTQEQDDVVQMSQEGTTEQKTRPNTPNDVVLRNDVSKEGTTEATEQTTSEKPVVDKVPDTGIFTAHLECGHTRKMDFTNKSSKTNSPTCSKCPNKQRRRIIRLEFIEDSKPHASEKEPRQDETPADNVAAHIEQLRMQINEHKRQNEHPQTQNRSLTDMVSSKDATLRKYLTQVPQMTNTVNRTEHFA